MRVAPLVALSDEQREVLEARGRARRASARSVERAQIVLLAAAGWQNREIAAQMRVTPEKVARWRPRFLTGGWPRSSTMRRGPAARARSRRPTCAAWST
jgi:FixJ family two-component response regulator